MARVGKAKGNPLDVPAVFRLPAEVRSSLNSHFPNLGKVRWSIKSPWDNTYKCISWAACRTDVIWWPTGGMDQIYWPPGAAMNDSIDAFVQAFATIGYVPCGGNVAFELGYQKVAIYASTDGRVQHMARQHAWGRGWLSKLGKLEDILHSDLECIEGDPSPRAVRYGSYGKVALALRRTWWRAILNGDLFRGGRTAFSFWLYRLAHPSWIIDNVAHSLSDK